MEESLSSHERLILLKLARQAIEEAVHGEPLSPLDLLSLPEALRQPGASFVTLTKHGELRGHWNT
jgi:AMMECR1 domain-containing protein